MSPQSIQHSSIIIVLDFLQQILHYCCLSVARVSKECVLGDLVCRRPCFDGRVRAEVELDGED